MTTEDISYSLERSKMEELLYDLSLGIVEAKNKRLSEEDLDFLCEKGFAFKLTDKDLIGSKYLRNYVIKLLKKDEKLDIRLKIGTHLISPFLVSNILNDLVIEGVALREGKYFVPNIEKFISEDSIENICRHRLDTLTIENITKEIGFTAKVVASFGEKAPSNAYIRCKHIVEALVQKNILVQDKFNIDIFYWNFEKED